MQRRNVWHECLMCATYYAPRGKPRLLTLGSVIGQRYLSPEDKLIGIIGEPGTGKSSVVRGMFPGLELTNDDEGINMRPCPLIKMHNDGRFLSHSFHIDFQFESAFAQPYEIAEAVKAALKDGRRVIVEHFNELYPVLGLNAQCLIGIGENIIVARPNIFGPFPKDIKSRIDGTAYLRKMAHSAEDITSMVLEEEFGYVPPTYHSDVPHGFVIKFDSKPENIDLDLVERKVREVIAAGTRIDKKDENHITVGDRTVECTGPRIHVGNSSEIVNFRLLKTIRYDEINDVYCLVGIVGEAADTEWEFKFNF